MLTDIARLRLCMKFPYKAFIFLVNPVIISQFTRGTSIESLRPNLF